MSAPEPERPEPVVRVLLEAIAGVLDLDTGRRRLELIFEHGRLREWSTHQLRRRIAELADYDERAHWILEVNSLGEPVPDAADHLEVDPSASPFPTPPIAGLPFGKDAEGQRERAAIRRLIDGGDAP